MRRNDFNSGDKYFKFFSIMLFSICFVMFYMVLHTKHLQIDKEMSEENLRNVVIEFDEGEDDEDSEKNHELRNFLKEVHVLNEEEAKLKNNNASTNVASVVRTQHVLVVAGWRTGSTLTGDILKAYPRTFYHYEPFLFVQQELEKINTTIATDVLKHLFLCNFSHIDPLLMYNNDKQWPWSFNNQLWPYCNAFQEFCKSSRFLSSTCKIFPVQVIKTVRVTLNQIAPLFDESALNLKLILLIRDPRGVMNSRSKQNWCLESQNCMSIDGLCKRMEADYFEAKRLKSLVKDRILVLRYEDLVSWPHRTTKRMYEFVGIEMTREVMDYLNTNTISLVGRTKPEIASMMRRRGAFYSHWVNEMEYEVIEEVQKYCKKAMELFGYRLMDDWTEKSTTFESLSNFTF